MELAFPLLLLLALLALLALINTGTLIALILALPSMIFPLSALRLKEIFPSLMKVLLLLSLPLWPF
jgi:hypothetical protein